MTATATKPPSSKNSSYLSKITSTGNGLPSRIVAFGPAGSGKTSWPAYSNSPIYIQSLGETGLETLIDSKRLPEVPHFPECTEHMQVIEIIRELQTAEHDRKTLVLDTLNGIEELIHMHVCKRDFGGKKAKFDAYQTGPRIAQADWKELLFELDKLRSLRKMAIICLVHSKVAPFKNPEGPDFDQYTMDLSKEGFALTTKWADMVLFQNYHTEVIEDGLRKKGSGGKQRSFFTEQTAAYFAKNRHGLEEEIDMGDSGEEAWNNLKNAVIAAKKASE